MATLQTNLLIESLPQDPKSAILARCCAVSLPVNTVLFVDIPDYLVNLEALSEAELVRPVIAEDLAGRHPIPVPPLTCQAPPRPKLLCSVNIRLA